MLFGMITNTLVNWLEFGGKCINIYEVNNKPSNPRNDGNI